MRSLPGDMMFQVTHVVDGFQRPCVLHGYGGAKSSMPTSLPALAVSGWTVLAAALLGTKDKPPLWTALAGEAPSSQCPVQVVHTSNVPTTPLSLVTI